MRTLSGIVKGGLGVASGVLAPCHHTIQQRSGKMLVQGTLNVHLTEAVCVVADFVMDIGECTNYESQKFQHCKINGIEALIMRTSTQEAGNSHPLNCVEIMASVNLRQALNVKDGDQVSIEAEF